MSTTIERYLPLFDEVILRNPIAVRLNAMRCLGLTDIGEDLNRQTLITAVLTWKKRENATDDDVTNKLLEILNVNAAVTHAFEDMGVVVKNVAHHTEGLNGTKSEFVYGKGWHYVMLGLLFLGMFAVLFGGFYGLKKIIVKN